MTLPANRGLRRLRSLLRRSRVDDGRAIVEFVFLGVLLLVPLVYLVLVVARVQAAAFSVSVASREAGRAFTTAATDAEGYARAEAAAEISFEDYGFADVGSVAIACDGVPCLRPDGRVTSQATAVVRLPLLPDFLAAALPTSVPVSATHVAVVDRFAGR